MRDAVQPLPADARGLLPALVIGDTSLTPQELTDDMLVTGMSHLSAVSGSNVAVVLAALVGACRLGGVPRR
ncbi:ComEC/Rec2 family competence protein, partial [Janibacter anophelis]